jgi:hypothetical protein
MVNLKILATDQMTGIHLVTPDGQPLTPDLSSHVEIANCSMANANQGFATGIWISQPIRGLVARECRFVKGQLGVLLDAKGADWSQVSLDRITYESLTTSVESRVGPEALSRIKEIGARYANTPPRTAPTVEPPNPSTPKAQSPAPAKPNAASETPAAPAKKRPSFEN